MEFVNLFQRHWAEVLTLVNGNQKVATVWHRCKGPVWIRLLLRAAHMPGMPIPTKAGEIGLQEAIQRLAEVLTRFASVPFRNDLQRYVPELGLIGEKMSFGDIIRLIGNRRAITMGT